MQNSIASTYGVHPSQIAQWKKHLERELPQIFSSRRDRREQEHEAVQAQLDQQIGQLKVEVDWLKKKLDLPPDAKRRLLEPAHPQISLARQCALLGGSRSSFYYRPRGERAVLDFMALRVDTILNVQYGGGRDDYADQRPA